MSRSARVRDPQPGIGAKWEGDCPRCTFRIHVGDRISYVRGVPIHCECASGSDDD